jgi:ankyrin repeat protein
METGTRSTVISVRVDAEALEAIDLLVQAGLAGSRSDAAAQLISRGVGASASLLEGARRVATELQALKQEMFGAVKARDVARVQALLDQDGRLASARTPEGDSPVLTAVYHGAGEIAQLLMSRGAQLNLYEAAAMGDGGRVAGLLAESPDLLDSFSHDGWTPIHLAAFFGHTAVVADLLKRGAKIDPTSRNGMANRPLHAALAARRWETARLLLQHGAAVNDPDGHGWTPLHLTAANGSAEMVAELLERGAAVGARNGKGETALDLALAQGHHEVAALLRQGA